MRAWMGWIIPLVSACGLSIGGLDVQPGTDGGAPDAADVSVDLNVEDRGTMETESGVPCICVPPNAEADGWTYVAGQPAKGTCPPNWAAMPSGQFLWNPVATGYGCTCGCNNAVNPTCTVPGTIALQYGQQMCGGITTTSPSGITVGQCKDWDQGNLNGSGFEQTVRVSSGLVQNGGMCGNATVARGSGSIAASDAQICGSSLAASTCMNGDKCVIPPAMPYRLCVAKTNPMDGTMCPPGFPKSIDGTGPGPTRIGTMTDDTGITCGACNCSGGPGTCNFAVDFGDGTCGNNMGTKLFTATANCATNGQGQNGFRPRSFRVNATPAIACTPSYTTQSPNGAPSLGGTVAAICCQ